MSQLKELAIKLSDAQWEGWSFNCLPMPGEQEVLQVTLSEQDEIPLYITITDSQMLCIAYLFMSEEVKDEMKDELNEQCLQLNIPMPLSAFAKMGNQYVLFGALSTSSSFENIQKELVTLGENAPEALEALENYLK
jgi:hypothetical protein